MSRLTEDILLDILSFKRVNEIDSLRLINKSFYNLIQRWFTTKPRTVYDGCTITIKRDIFYIHFFNHPVNKSSLHEKQYESKDKSDFIRECQKPRIFTKQVGICVFQNQHSSDDLLQLFDGIKHLWTNVLVDICGSSLGFSTMEFELLFLKAFKKSWIVWFHSMKMDDAINFKEINEDVIRAHLDKDALTLNGQKNRNIILEVSNGGLFQFKKDNFDQEFAEFKASIS